MTLLIRNTFVRNVVPTIPQFRPEFLARSFHTSSSSSGSPLEMLDTTPFASPRFKFQLFLERLKFRNEWSNNLVFMLEDRLVSPRFGFPGVFDRSPPPPKTLHWTYAPVEGEYRKIRAILFWATLHIHLLDQRIAGSAHYCFLTDHLFDYLSSELTSKWLPEASIPSFSIKSEGKVLTDWCRETVFSGLKKGEFLDVIRAHGNCDIPDPLLRDLLSYIADQTSMLSRMDLRDVVQTSWKWHT